MKPHWVRRRRRAAVAPAPDLLDTVAAAIAQAAGHNWHAAMMPDYRAEFRRFAAAAIAAFRGAA